jgi:hypothetical protein
MRRFAPPKARRHGANRLIRSAESEIRNTLQSYKDPNRKEPLDSTDAPSGAAGKAGRASTADWHFNPLSLSSRLCPTVAALCAASTTATDTPGASHTPQTGAGPTPAVPKGNRRRSCRTPNAGAQSSALRRACNAEVPVGATGFGRPPEPTGQRAVHWIGRYGLRKPASRVLGYWIRTLPWPGTTWPMIQARCPRLAINRTTASAQPGSVMATMPMPMLKT